jgi:arsenite-transporting ATPase
MPRACRARAGNNQQSKLPDTEKRLLVFAGKGGVGKTTLACATAARMARTFPDKGVFLFSTDPAHSLSDCLGKRIGAAPTEIIPGLTAMEIDAQAEFDGLKKKYAAELERFLAALSPDLDLTFDREVMERVMDLSPPGLDEVMALTLAMGFLAEDRYQVFVLDSAPTGHLIRLLETPELIQQWLKMFFNLFLKYKRVFRLPGISEQMIRISKDLKRLRALLKDSDRSALYAVSILTEMAFQETADLVDGCRRMGINVPALFLNLATPVSECPLCSALNRNEEQIRKKFERTFPEKSQVLVHYMGETRGMLQIQALGEEIYD